MYVPTRHTVQLSEASAIDIQLAARQYNLDEVAGGIYLDAIEAKMPTPDQLRQLRLALSSRRITHVQQYRRI